jgi:hypothetical protein
MEKGYLLTYRWVQKLLVDCDLVEAARRLGIGRFGGVNVGINIDGADDGIIPNGAAGGAGGVAPVTLALDFLGRSYSVTNGAVELESERVVWESASEGIDYNIKSVLGYYVLSEAACEPVGDYCQLSHFSHGVFREGLFAGKIPRAYGDSHERFGAGVGLLGMDYEGALKDGQYGWRYRLLPKLPVRVVWYDGDEDFPSSVQVLYDKTAIDFFKFEPLAVLHHCFLESLGALAGSVGRA